MPDTIQPSETLDAKTRSNLAYMWSMASIIMLVYILYNWGNRVEILTLIIGLIGGTVLGGIFGVYFGGVTTNKKMEPTVQNTGDNPQTTVTTPPAT